MFQKRTHLRFLPQKSFFTALFLATLCLWGCRAHEGQTTNQTPQTQPEREPVVAPSALEAVLLNKENNPLSTFSEKTMLAMRYETLRNEIAQLVCVPNDLSTPSFVAGHYALSVFVLNRKMYVSNAESELKKQCQNELNQQNQEPTLTALSFAALYHGDYVPIQNQNSTHEIKVTPGFVESLPHATLSNISLICQDNQIVLSNASGTPIGFLGTPYLEWNHAYFQEHNVLFIQITRKEFQNQGYTFGTTPFAECHTVYAAYKQYQFKKVVFLEDNLSQASDETVLNQVYTLPDKADHRSALLVCRFRNNSNPQQKGQHWGVAYHPLQTRIPGLWYHGTFYTTASHQSLVERCKNSYPQAYQTQLWTLIDTKATRYFWAPSSPIEYVNHYDAVYPSNIPSTSTTAG